METTQIARILNYVAQKKPCKQDEKNVFSVKKICLVRFYGSQRTLALTAFNLNNFKKGVWALRTVTKLIWSS